MINQDPNPFYKNKESANNKPNKNPLQQLDLKKAGGILIIILAISFLLYPMLFKSKDKKIITLTSLEQPASGESNFDLLKTQKESTKNYQALANKSPPTKSNHENLSRKKLTEEEQAFYQQRLQAKTITYVGNSSHRELTQDKEPSLDNFESQHSNTPQNLNHTILPGKVIQATLETAVNSQLPGMLRALVNENIYGEAGNNVLIPRGSRLIGQYQNDINMAQTRVMIVWEQLILPNGQQVALSSPGTDTLGRSGVTGNVNTHFWQRFGQAALMSLISAGASNVGVDSNTESNSASYYREQIAENFAESARESLQSRGQIAPTINIKAGEAVTVFVVKALSIA